MTLVKRKPEAWPSPFGWLPRPYDQGRLAIMERSRQDVGILETAPNRGPEIDGYLRRAFTPEDIILAGRGNWCAAWVGCVLIDAGAMVPKDFGSCDAWIPFLERCTLAQLPSFAVPGDVILYGKELEGGKLDAHHIGILWRLTPIILSNEGNRGLAGGAVNNGVAVDVGPVNRTDVLGIVKPVFA